MSGFIPVYEPGEHPCESDDKTRKHAGWTYKSKDGRWLCLAHVVLVVQDASEKSEREAAGK